MEINIDLIMSSFAINDTLNERSNMKGKGKEKSQFSTDIKGGDLLQIRCDSNAIIYL
jgi:hypothetical protein